MWKSRHPRNLHFLRTRRTICETRNPEDPQNPVFPRETSNLSNSGIPKVAQSEDVSEGFGVSKCMTITKVAQIEDVYEGFGVSKSVAVAKVAQNEDVYEGFGVFWSKTES